MARSPSHPRPLSADFTCKKSPSMLYSLLPTAVQSRLPELPSLRRSASMYGLTTRRKSFASAPPSGARTPEARFGNAMVLSGRTEEDSYFADGSSEEDLNIHVQSRNTKAGHLMLDEQKSGIGWKYANQGDSFLVFISIRQV